MSCMADWLRGKRIQDVYVDSEVLYVMLSDGTQVTIKGLVVVEPNPSTVLHSARSIVDK